MRHALPFQTLLAALVSLCGIFIFRESLIQHVRLSTKRVSTRHGSDYFSNFATNNMSAVPPSDPTAISLLQTQKSIQHQTEHHVPERKETLLPLRICRDDTVVFDPDDPLYMRYICQGPNYNVFSQRLLEYMNDTAHHHAATWGRRPVPLPANTSIFIFGNSHTGQTAKSLLCQYQDQIKTLKTRLNGNEGYTVEFRNGAVVESLINSYALYGYNWKDLVEREIHKTLDSFHALVLGKFNHLKDSQNTTFYKQMKEISKVNPDVDFFKVKPPALKDVAAVYSGNIVAVGMFSNKPKALQESRRMRLDKARLVQEEGRVNVRFINGRKFVKILKMEGGSMNRLDISDSVENGTAHRCNGVHGGHPDLMSWEIIEKLNDLMSQ